MLKNRKKKESDKQTQFDELMTYFYEVTSVEAKPRMVSQDRETLISYVDEMLHLYLHVITLLSRKPVDNELNMLFNLYTSQKAGKLVGMKKANKENEHQHLILSLCMEEGYLFLGGLKSTMYKAHEARAYCFKDEIRAIEDYTKTEWSLYLNNKPNQ